MESWLPMKPKMPAIMSAPPPQPPNVCVSGSISAAGAFWPKVSFYDSSGNQELNSATELDHEG